MSDTPRKLHPKIVEWSFFQDGLCLQIMIYLMAKAKLSTTTWMTIPIKRGETVVGRGALSSVTGRGETEVRTRIGWLKKNGEISLRKIEHEGREYGVIKLVKFNEYQKDEPAKREPTEYMKAQTKIKEKPFSDEFNEWYNVYKKGNKRNAWVRWQELKPSLPDLAGLIEITNQYIEYCISIERTRMDAEGWLNRRFFETEWTHEGQGTKPEVEEDVQFG